MKNMTEKNRLGLHFTAKHAFKGTQNWFHYHKIEIYFNHSKTDLAKQVNTSDLTSRSFVFWLKMVGDSYLVDYLKNALSILDIM
jgi:hypothetical protein